MLSIARSAVVPALFLLQNAAAQAGPSISNPCGDCSYGQAGYFGGWWTTASVMSTAAIEAVTVVVTTNGDGTTSTSTIFNFPSNAPVPVTDAAGYPVYTKTLTYGSKVITTALTWPTGYVSYRTGDFWTGTIPAPSTLGFPNSTSQACLTATTGSFSDYGTAISPIFPTPTSSSSADLPYASFDPDLWWQWTFFDDDEVADANCFGTYATTVFSNYATLLPSFPVYEYCSAPTEIACAPVALQTVAYLTVTSHRSRAGESTPAPLSSSPAPTRATAVPVETSRGPITTIGVTRTVAAAATPAGSTAEPSTSTITVDGGDGGNPHTSRSIIRTSPLDPSAAEVAATSKKGASSRVHAPASLAWAVFGGLAVALHTLG